jgi:hypothetical protein
MNAFLFPFDVTRPVLCVLRGMFVFGVCTDFMVVGVV